MPDQAERGALYTRAKRWLRVVAPIAGSLLVLAALYRRVDVERLRDALRAVDPVVIAGASCLALPFVLLKSYKWHRLAVRVAPEAPYSLSVRSFLIGVAASLVTPGRLGEFARVACFRRRRKELLALIVVDKLIDVGVLCVLCAAVAWSYSWRMGILACAGIGLLMAAALGVRQWRHRFMDRVRDAAPAHEIAANGAMSVGCYGLLTMQLHLVLSATGAAPLRASMRTLAPVVLGSAMPLFVSGFGSREAIAVALLGSHGIAAERAVISGLLLFAVSTPLPALVGIVLAALQARRTDR